MCVSLAVCSSAVTTKMATGYRSILDRNLFEAIRGHVDHSRTSLYRISRYWRSGDTIARYRWPLASGARDNSPIHFPIQEKTRRRCSTVSVERHHRRWKAAKVVAIRADGWFLQYDPFMYFGLHGDVEECSTAICPLVYFRALDAAIVRI